MTIQRIAIMGCSGSGKSTLARALGRATGLPVFHMDQLYWQPGWVAPADEDAFHQRIRQIIASEQWILDGGFATTIAERFQAADLVVLFDRPRWQCLRRAMQRIVKGYGAVRPDTAPGCPERLDLEFFQYIWTYRRQRWPGILAAAEKHAPAKTVILRSDGDMAELIARFAG